MSNEPDLPAGEHLVFYDGTCGFCHATVQFLLKHDHKRQLLFAPLQGSAAKTLLTDCEEVAKEIEGKDTIVFLENYKDKENQRLAIYSTAVFRTLRYLDGGWRFLAWMEHLPKWLSNTGYRIIAHYRLKLRGESKACLIPPAADRSRFLD
jgi:predicted DCC family thiol-disulfide oxidoreductase YuxK